MLVRYFIVIYFFYYFWIISIFKDNLFSGEMRYYNYC